MNNLRVNDFVKIRRTDDITSKEDLVGLIGKITGEDCDDNYEVYVEEKPYWFRSDSLELVEDKRISLYDVLYYVQLYKNDPVITMQKIVNYCV